RLGVTERAELQPDARPVDHTRARAGARVLWLAVHAATRLPDRDIESQDRSAHRARRRSTARGPRADRPPTGGGTTHRHHHGTRTGDSRASPPSRGLTSPVTTHPKHRCVRPRIWYGHRYSQDDRTASGLDRPMPSVCTRRAYLLTLTGGS